MQTSALIALVASLGSVLSSPVPQGVAAGGTPYDGSVTIGDLTTEQVLAFAPGSSCSNPQFGATECTPASTAAPLLNTALKDYSDQTLGRAVAVISLMAFESADFTANINHFPGRPGQGTKAMLNFPFIYAYALAQPELSTQVMQLSGDAVDMNNLDGVPDETQTAIRALVLPDKYTFASASYYMKANCPAMGPQLDAGGLSAYQSYISTCVGTEFTPDHQAKWCAVVNALKPSGMSSPAECASE